jgi:hypothetical protein
MPLHKLPCNAKSRCIYGVGVTKTGTGGGDSNQTGYSLESFPLHLPRHPDMTPALYPELHPHKLLQAHRIDNTDTGANELST